MLWFEFALLVEGTVVHCVIRLKKNFVELLKTFVALWLVRSSALIFNESGGTI